MRLQICLFMYIICGVICDVLPPKIDIYVDSNEAKDAAEVIYKRVIRSLQ